MNKRLNFCILLVCFFTASLPAQVQREFRMVLGEHPQSFSYDKPVKNVNVSGERLLYIDQLLREYVDQGIIPQALTFVAKNGVVIHNKAFGWSDIENKKALKKDDVFRNYSQTKAIATVALMTLYEQGK